MKKIVVTLLALIAVLFAFTAVAEEAVECDHQWVVFGFGAGYCTKCGAITTDDDEVFPDGKECMTHGYDANTGLCTSCGAKQPEADHEHEWTKFSFGGWICNKCQLITINNPHPDHQLPEGDPNCEHNWVQATYSGWVCSKCGAMTINQPGCQHEKTSTLVYDASCVEAGWTKTYCMNTQCTKVLEQTVLPIDKDAHGEKKTETVAATCKATGYTKVSCSLCDKVLEEIILPIGDHDWVDGVCSVCGTKQIKTKYYYNNTMCSFGPTTREVIGGNDWYRVTPIDLSVDGVYTYDLIASNVYVVGKVTITVSAGALTVDYSANNSEVVVKEETLLFYASKADMAAGTAVEAKVGEAVDMAATFGEDTKIIVSLILVGDYNAYAAHVTTMDADDAVIATMLANVD